MRIDLEIDGEWREFLANPKTSATLTDWMRHENLPLNTRCGERGLCQACEVEVEDKDGQWEVRQACKLPVREGLRVRVPAAARLAYRPQVMDRYEIGVPFALASEWGSQGLVAAVDIGTTTVTVVVLDLADGVTVGSASSFNQQIGLGDDVLTRINLCRTDPDALARLGSAIWNDTLWPLAKEAAGERLDQIVGWTLAGNPSMLHLAAGIDPGPMGVSPFPVPQLGSQRVDSLPAANGLPVRFLPHVAAYVGSDIVAGLAASGFEYGEGSALYVDIGTNGEIVCRHNGRLVGCATAAGPAFEGSGLTCGVRAGDGAISGIELDPDGAFRLQQIGDPKAKPIGICGSAYVDFLAQGYKCGWLSASGRAAKGMALPSHDGQGGWFRLAKAAGKREIGITELDVARLLQAKAAIAAGIRTLLEILGLQAGQIQRLFLAGGFGMHVNHRSAIECGLLPGFREDQIHLVGNASLAGAHLAALDISALHEMERLAQRIDVVELNLHPGFEDAYLDELGLARD